MQVLGTLQGKALEGLSAALNSAGAAGFRLCDRGSLVGLHNGLPGRSGCTASDSGLEICLPRGR